MVRSDRNLMGSEKASLLRLRAGWHWCGGCDGCGGMGERALVAGPAR